MVNRPAVLRQVDEHFEPPAGHTGWMDEALCRQVGPGPWYAEAESDTGRYAIPRTPGQRDDLRAEAIAMCRRCPVRAACLAHALATDERYGIWGGVDMEARAGGTA